MNVSQYNTEKDKIEYPCNWSACGAPNQRYTDDPASSAHGYRDTAFLFSIRITGW
jgi:hypothetical protein